MDINRLLLNDPLALQLVKEAVDAFGSTKRDRELLGRIRDDATQLAQNFIDIYAASDPDASGLEEIRAAMDSIRIERKVANVPREFLEIYRNLGLIRDFSSRLVQLDFPQSLADPVILRGYSQETLEQIGDRGHFELQPLIDAIEGATRDTGFTLEQLQPEVAKHYNSLSRPLLLTYQALEATKVYFMGPVFYGDAGKDWTLTFATGSGLPDPLEWNGALWFMRRYGASPELLEKHGIRTDKNPFRALNFSLGICNKLWTCKRLYVWQTSKTTQQVRAAYSTAIEVGKGNLYLRDALEQLLNVFSTTDLKILSVDEFPKSLKAWTRVSPTNTMLSCRPGTPEARIGHGIWLKPGLRVSTSFLKLMARMEAGLLAFAAKDVSSIGFLLGILANVGVLYLVERGLEGEAARHHEALRVLKTRVSKSFARVWNTEGVPGTIKEQRSYGRQEALSAASKTLSSLLGTISASDVLSAYRRSQVAE